MSVLSPITSASLEHAVGVGSAVFGASMLAGSYYAFVSTTDCWIQQGATPTATAGAGSMFVPAKTVWFLDGAAGADLAVIQDTAGGKASLTRCLKY